MKVRVIYKEDGSVSVVYPAIKSRKATETENEWLERVFSKATPENADYEDMESSELPDQTDRDAWEKRPGGGIRISNRKKKEVMDRRLIDDEKDALLEKLAVDSLIEKGVL